MANKSIVRAIAASGLSIYDPLTDNPDLYIATADLEAILNERLKGLVLNQPIRTRSKVLKCRVCSVLGYPVPKRFKKTRPRFLGQNFDTYVQKANNLQVWNEEVSSSRRYVLIRVDASDVVTKVRVVTGDVIAALDNTGTLTHKFQAKAKTPPVASHLVSAVDTSNTANKLIAGRPLEWTSFLPIAQIYPKLVTLVSTAIIDPGITQERNRGGSLHQAVGRCLGQSFWQDNGQFPDVKDQLLEVKLQTAPTIDLGLVCPDSIEPIDDLPSFRHCDVRYAVF